MDIDFAIDSLRTLLERGADGWMDMSAGELADAAQSRLEEIWEMIPPAEKKTDLAVYYEDLMRELESITGYEADFEDEYFDEEE